MHLSRLLKSARNLDTHEQRTHARDEIVRKWSSVNAKAALDWLIDDGLNIDQQNETSIFEQAFSSYLSQDFESAEHFARNYQGTLKKLFVEAVASHLISIDVEQAIDYLPNVNRENRNSLQIDIGVELVDFDPLKALSYGETVEKSSRRSYYERVLKEWADDDLFALHKNLQRVPREHRMYAAETLLIANESERALSDRQIQNLESMVSKREVPSSAFSATIQIDNDNNASVQIHRR